MANYFDKIIAEAKAEVATWSEEKRRSVQLEGFDEYAEERERTCRHCGCVIPCQC